MHPESATPKFRSSKLWNGAGSTWLALALFPPGGPGPDDLSLQTAVDDMRTVQKLTALKRRSWRDMHNFELANPANEFRSVSTIKELEHRELDQQAGVYIQSSHTVTWKNKMPNKHR